MAMHCEVPLARHAGVAERSAQSTKHQSWPWRHVLRVTPCAFAMVTEVTARAAGAVGSRSVAGGGRSPAIAERTGPNVAGGYASQTVPSTTWTPRASSSPASRKRRSPAAKAPPQTGAGGAQVAGAAVGQDAV